MFHNDAFHRFIMTGHLPSGNHRLPRASIDAIVADVYTRIVPVVYYDNVLKLLRRLESFVNDRAGTALTPEVKMFMEVSVSEMVGQWFREIDIPASMREGKSVSLEFKDDGKVNLKVSEDLTYYHAAHTPARLVATWPGFSDHWVTYTNGIEMGMSLKK